MLVLEPLSLDDDCVRGFDGRERTVFKIKPSTLFVNLDYGRRIGSPFLADNKS